jgi:hypothetical protein
MPPALVAVYGLDMVKAANLHRRSCRAPINDGSESWITQLKNGQTFQSTRERPNLISGVLSRALGSNSPEIVKYDLGLIL